MKRLVAPALALSLLGAVSAVEAADEIKVMTQNQYLGANLNAIILAPDPSSFNAAVVEVLRQIVANDFPARVVLLAEQISSRQPHLVALQEVFTFECVPITMNACEDPSIAGAFNDHLERTLSTLAAQGADYVEAAKVVNLSLPGILVDLDTPGPGDPFLPDIMVSVLDHDVILARGDVPTSKLTGHVMDGGLCGLPVFPPSLGVSTPSADGCNFAVIATVPSPVGTIPIQRGFVAVDATIEGRAYRFVDTHLEVQDPAPIVQALQATELIATLHALTPASLSLVVAGDINSSSVDPPFIDPQLGPTAPPYLQFVLAGFADGWDLRPGRSPGFTCCQLGDLSNSRSIVDERIDVVFSRILPIHVKANVLGNEPSDKTPRSRLWPSDHAALVMELTYD